MLTDLLVVLAGVPVVLPDLLGVLTGSCGDDGVVILWNLTTGALIKDLFLARHEPGVR